MNYILKKIVTGLIFAFGTAAVFAAGLGAPAVIPLPQQMDVRPGAFQLTPETEIYASHAALPTARQLAVSWRAATGYPLRVHWKWWGSHAVRHGIFLTTKSADAALGAEGYDLAVTTNFVVIRARAQAGLFYGAETLRQLLPPEIFATNRVAKADWAVPCLQIRDWPRFPWRGLMLDVSRHFYNKDEVERVLDLMALYKLNRFHMHLADSQGWRIEIKKYPLLTQVGAWRMHAGLTGPNSQGTNAHPAWAAATADKFGPDGRYGGFYTQDDIRALVAYAAARHITIVPEIEMPGHSTAALAAYPEFSCTGGPFTIPLKGGVFDGIYNPANEQTMKFLDDVLREVVGLFPGKYIHVGGDEVPKETWKKSVECQAFIKRQGLKNEEELQSWFVRRIEKTVNAHGRTLIGWSEILQGGLAKNATVMDWIGGAKEAAGAGHDVVMTPTSYCYFDFYQSTNHATEPKAASWGDPLTLDKMYSYEPMPTNVPPELQSHILGAQGNLWTEWIPNLNQVEFMAFPRACALAEVTWSAKASRDHDDFMRRLQIHARRLDQLGINYRHASVVNPKAE